MSNLEKGKAMPDEQTPEMFIIMERMHEILRLMRDNRSKAIGILTMMDRSSIPESEIECDIKEDDRGIVPKLYGLLSNMYHVNSETHDALARLSKITGSC